MRRERKQKTTVRYEEEGKKSAIRNGEKRKRPENRTIKYDQMTVSLQEENINKN